MKRRSLVYFGISLAVSTMISPIPAFSSSSSAIAQRVQFESGRSSIIIDGEVEPGNKNTYVFRARGGQEIIIDVVWDGTIVDENEDQGLTGFTFIQPDGTIFADPQDGYFNAGATGDYQVIIAQPHRLTSPKYKFKLTIR